MNARRSPHTVFSRICLAAVLVLGLLPLLRLGFVALTAPPAATPDTAWSLDARTLGLLVRSLGIALGATLGALALGSLMALPLARVSFRGRGALGFALLAAFAVSPYWMALGWLRGDLASPAAQVFLGNPWAVALVLATAHAPGVALLVLLAARALPVGWEEAALLAAPLRRVLLEILLPQLRPLVGVIGLLVFALCFADYEVASLLQVVTYPVEVFLLYAGVFAPGQAARACAPLLLVSLVTASALGALLSRTLARQWPARVAGAWPLTPTQRRTLLWLSLGVAAACTLWPAFGLLGQLGAPRGIGAALRDGAPALVNSLTATACAAGLALALGVAASGALIRATLGSRAVLAILLLLPACLPGPVYGIAWVELMSVAPAVLRVALASLPALGPALCLAARWAGVVALLVAAARRALPTSALDAAALQQGSAARRFVRIELPWIAPALLASGAVLCALAQSAVGVLVLTVPPGFEVAPLRIDNLLHYGSRADAVALAVACAVFAAALPLALAAAARRVGNRLA
jgi:ABC-type Fe3+ transport system permease subunit